MDPSQTWERALLLNNEYFGGPEIGDQVEIGLDRWMRLTQIFSGFGHHRCLESLCEGPVNRRSTRGPLEKDSEYAILRGFVAAG
jgi:hypothetical protein